MPEATGVLVVGDSIDGELSPTSRELLAVGRKAADDLGEELAISLMGDTLDVPLAAGDCIRRGQSIRGNSPAAGRVPGGAFAGSPGPAMPRG